MKLTRVEQEAVDAAIRHVETILELDGDVLGWTVGRKRALYRAADKLRSTGRFRFVADYPAPVEYDVFDSDSDVYYGRVRADGEGRWLALSPIVSDVDGIIGWWVAPFTDFDQDGDPLSFDTREAAAEWLVAS